MVSHFKVDLDASKIVTNIKPYEVKCIHNCQSNIISSSRLNYIKSPFPQRSSKLIHDQLITIF